MHREVSHAARSSIIEITLEDYHPGLQSEWDRCIAGARNGAFWFQRAYLEYHGDRFSDASMLFRDGKGKIIAVLPAHFERDGLRSHGGLPFAGLIVTPKCSLEDTEVIFSLLADKMRRSHLRTLTYAAMPYPYADWPQDEAVYLLKKLGARCVDTKLSAMTALNGRSMIDFLSSHRRKEVLRVSRKYPYVFTEEKDLSQVWPELENFLRRRYGREPVHSLEEIIGLQSAFPDSIRLLVARCEGRLVGGQLLYLFGRVMRCQYAFRTGELCDDYLSLRLDLEACSVKEWQRDWIDLGTSVDPDTGEMNQSLYRNKEHSGGRGVCLETWVWEPG